MLKVEVHLDGLVASESRYPAGALSEVLQPLSNICRRVSLGLTGQVSPKPNREELYSVEVYARPFETGSFGVVVEVISRVGGAIASEGFARLAKGVFDILSGKKIDPVVEELSKIRGLLEATQMDHPRQVISELAAHLEPSYKRIATHCGEYFETATLGVVGSRRAEIGLITRAFKDELEFEKVAEQSTWLTVTVRKFDRKDGSGILLVRSVSEATAENPDSLAGLAVSSELEMSDKAESKNLLAQNLSANTGVRKAVPVSVLARLVTSKAGRKKRLLVSAVRN